jgi:acetolactate synthase-1/2/3 large subunit
MYLEFEFSYNLLKDTLMVENTSIHSFQEIVVTKPWGYEYLLFENSKVAIWLLCLNSKKRTSLHYHAVKDTQLVVVSGKLQVTIGADDYQISDGQMVTIPKGISHQTANNTDSPAYLIELEYPNNKLDLVRLKDDFGRTGLDYEKQSDFKKRLPNHDFINFNQVVSNAMITKRIRDCRIHFIKGSADYLQNVCDLSKINQQSLIFSLNDECNQKSSLDSKKVTSLSGYLECLDLTEKCELMIIENFLHAIPGYDLVTHELQNIFENPFIGTLGSQSLHFVNHAARVEGLEIELFHSDETATLAAEGLSFIKSKASLMFLSSDKGSVEALRGILNCTRDQTPLVVLKFEDNNFEFTNSVSKKEIDFQFMSGNFFKGTLQINHNDIPNNLSSKLKLAKELAESGPPGPVLISIPISLLTNEYSIKPDQLLNQPLYKVSKTKSQQIWKDSELSKLINCLENSERPLAIVGRAAQAIFDSSEIQYILNAMLNRKIPIVTTRSAIDFLHHQHGQNFGRVGSYGNRYSNKIASQADLILFLGTSVSQALIGRSSKNFVSTAKKFFVHDLNFLGKYNLKSFIDSEFDHQGFLHALQNSRMPNEFSLQKWWKYCSHLKENYGQETETHEQSSPADIGLVIAQLTKLAPNETTFCVDGGNLLHQFSQNAQLKEGQRVVTSSIMEATGISFASAVGVSFENENISHQTVAISDSFGIIKNLQHLKSVNRNFNKLKLIYLRDKNTNLSGSDQRFFYPASTVGTNLSHLDFNFKLICDAYGLSYCNFGTNLDMKFSSFMQESKNVLVGEISVTNSNLLIPRASFTIGSNQEWIQNSFEEMVPFKLIPNFTTYSERVNSEYC